MHTLSQSSICECFYLCCMKQSMAFECKHPVLSLDFDGMFVQDIQTLQYQSTKNYRQQNMKTHFKLLCQKKIFNEKILRILRRVMLAEYN